ncbi:MAG: GNAT family N-acetyltransferase [Planctomycetales bacterium]|nr:GNAT family N-acetyltransferase [Planctomycetales bacterium]
MEVRLDARPAVVCDLADGFVLLPWESNLSNRHAQAKFESFRYELDAHVFPCLAELDGCRKLMRDISNRADFVPEATWLACRKNDFEKELAPIGTIQGLLSSSGAVGAIQNIGVVPEFRDLGIGRILLSNALSGFQQIGCKYANLEVTVQNSAAIRLYEKFGFRRVETLFKMCEVQYA